MTEKGPPDSRRPSIVCTSSADSDVETEQLVDRMLTDEHTDRRCAEHVRLHVKEVDARIIQCSTYDNIINVGLDYIERLRSSVDLGPARAYIDGSMEQVSTGRT